MSFKQTKSILHHKARHHFIRLAVPHAQNDYHPHLIRWQSLSVALLFIIALQFVALLPHGSVLGESTGITAEQLLVDTNKERQAHKLTPLNLNSKLTKAATLKAQDIFKKQYWAHEAPDGTAPWHWFEESGYSYTYAGENLARGFRSSAGVTTAWKNSPEHLKNLLNANYQDAGFAVVSGTLQGQKTNVIVALYGAPNASGGTTSDVLAAKSSNINLLTRFGVGLQSMTPEALGSLVLLLVLMLVSLITYSYRSHIPKNIRTKWHKHHGIHKTIGMLVLIVGLVALYGTGQI